MHVALEKSQISTNELKEKFYGETFRTIIYCLSFVLLGMHLNHGLSSSFQSVGLSSAREKTLRTAANIYSVSISIGFTVIAIFHYFGLSRNFAAVIF